jgi:hypothetical protein
MGSCRTGSSSSFIVATGEITTGAGTTMSYIVGATTAGSSKMVPESSD